jgi:hypothetical protein
VALLRSSIHGLLTMTIYQIFMRNLAPGALCDRSTAFALW